MEAGSVVIELLANPTLCLFLVIGLGYLFGSVSWRGFSLGVAAVLFVGLAVGAWQPGRFELPPVVSTLGLALFVYTMGLASGPGAVAAIRRQGLQLTLGIAAVLAVTALVAVLATRVLQLDPGQAAGAFCGALTNTPALAAQLERLSGHPDEAARIAPALGYALTYPFGVGGLLLLMAGFAARPSVRAEQQDLSQAHPDVVNLTYRITTKKPNGNFLEADWVREATGMVVSRRRRGSEQQVATGDMVLEPGDLVAVVGTAEQHEQFGAVLGEVSTEHLEQVSREVVYARFFMSNREWIERTLGELPLSPDVVVTRVRRADVEIPATPNFRLQWGDVVRVVMPADKSPQVERLFGDSMSTVAHTDFMPMALGMVLGVLVGSVPLPFGGELGVAGGALLVGLALGYLGRTGPIIWTMPLDANLALRQFGLLLFLASVGIMAGGQFGQAFAQDGVRLMAVGVVLTGLNSLGCLLVCRRLLRMDAADCLGALAGAHTQPAALAYAQQRLPSSGVEVTYSAVFPTAMIVKIFLGSWLIDLL